MLTEEERRDSAYESSSQFALIEQMMLDIMAEEIAKMPDLSPLSVNISAANVRRRVMKLVADMQESALRAIERDLTASTELNAIREREKVERA